MPKRKIIEHGLAPPDHPIYKTGVVFCRTLKSILAEIGAPRSEEEESGKHGVKTAEPGTAASSGSHRLQRKPRHEAE